jgi:hypothetical protein
MKGLWIAPLLGLCMTGCVLLPTAETKPPASVKLSVTETVNKQSVSVEQINEANAKEMSMALNAELDQAQNGLVIAPEQAPAKPK